MTKSALFLTAVLALTLVPAAGCSSTPAHVGTGTMEALLVPLDLRPGAISVAPDESYLLVETQRDKNLVYTGNLETQKARELGYRAFAFSADSKSAAAVRPEEGVIVAIPDLRRLESFPKPVGAFNNRVELFALPGSEGFVAVSTDRSVPNVWMLGQEPPRFGPSGTTADPENLRGVAIDDATGRLVLTNDRNRFEIFDLATMRTEALFELPCREADYDIATGLGWAFVSTRDGVVIPVNVAERGYAEPIRVGGRGHLRVALSKSGRLLAVCHQDQGARKAPYPTTMKVYGVDRGVATELGSAYFEAEGPAMDIVVLETSGKVLLSCDPQLLCWTFE